MGTHSNSLERTTAYGEPAPSNHPTMTNDLSPRTAGGAATPGDDLHRSCVVIAGGELHNATRVRHYLEAEGYTNLHSATTLEQVPGLCAALDPDLLLLDLHMPREGFELLAELARRAGPEAYFPILVLTGDTSVDAKRQALMLGASEVLSTPADLFELSCRVRSLLGLRRQNRALLQQVRHLEERVRERAREVEAAQMEVLERLAHAAEFRDDECRQHTHRVGELAGRIARAMGLPEEQAELIGRAALLHDVGKIGVPDSVLLKPGPLTAEEFELVKNHTTMGAAMLAGGRTELLRVAEQIALHHHERWDGSGYPHGLSGEEIPLAARITAIADFVDSASRTRPYRSAWPMERILDSIRSNSGRLFDPRVVEALWRVQEEWNLEPEPASREGTHGEPRQRTASEGLLASRREPPHARRRPPAPHPGGYPFAWHQGAIILGDT